MPERQLITSLTGVPAQLLTVNSADARALDMTSLFLPRIWKKSPTFVCDDLVLEPLGQSLMNSEMSFELPKMAHFLTDLAVQKTSPAHTVAPLGAVPYYVDHLGFADVDEFKILFGSNLVYNRRSYDLYFDFRTRYTNEKQGVINYLVRGDQTQAQRNADLVNGITTITDMDLPFSRHQSLALPIHVLSQKTRFTYKSKPFNSIIAGTTVVPNTTVTPQGIYDYKLLIRVAHVTGSEAAIVLAQSRAPDGVSYMIHQNVRQESDDVFTATNSTQNIRLQSITKPIKFLRWALVPRRLVDDSGFNDFFFFRATPDPIPPFGPVPPGMNAYNPPLSWGITANGNIVQRQITRDVSRMWYWYHKHEAQGGDDIYEQNYAEYPHAVNAATGYQDYTNLNNPVIAISFDVGGTGVDPILGGVQVLRLIVNCEDYNWWVLHAGNWLRSLN